MRMQSKLKLRGDLLLSVSSTVDSVATKVKFVLHMMGFRLILMAAMGLGALYMVHLLAQDFNKIRKVIQPVTKVLLGKRDLSNLNKTKFEDKQEIHLTIDWNNILKNDPFKCLESLICQIVAGLKTENPDAENIQALIENNISNEKLPSKIITAYNNGLKYKKDPEKCYIVYKFCIYSARTMLNLLKWCSSTFS